MDDFTTAESQMMSNPGWRDLVLREATQRALHPHDGLPVVAEAAKSLLSAVHHAPDPTGAILALRRLTSAMRDFGGLSDAHRAALAGRLLPGEGMGKNGEQQAALVRERAREAWNSTPALADLLAEREARAEAAVALAARQGEARAAAEQVKAQRRREAPALLLDLHGRGVRLDLAEGGGLRAFPRLVLTDADMAALASHGAELADEVARQWVTA